MKLARYTLNNKNYALKIIDKIKLKTPERMAIKREIEVQKTIDHPNIIKLEGSFETDSKIVIVLEYASQGSLARILRKQKRLSEDESFKIFS